MNAHLPIASVAVTLATLLLIASPLGAQLPHKKTPISEGITRTDLQRHDISAKNREVVQVRVDFAPGAAAPEHSHPGEEIVYAIEGEMEYRVEGRERITLSAGDVLFIPAGATHAVRNVGQGNAAELATYIVEKGKPLVVLRK